MGTRRSRSSGQVKPYSGADGAPVPGSVAEKIHVDVNGVRQGMVIKARDHTNPVLLFVHGGPGMPEYFLESDYPTRLDELFTVVWWDQRGAGLSYSPDVPRSTMTVEQFVADTLAVTDFLLDRFGRRRLYLLGHSWGSFIAIQAAQRAPQRFHAYIGMAQIVQQLRSEKLAYDFMLAEYRRRGDDRMARALSAAPVTMEQGLPRKYLRIRDTAMHRLGVGTMHDMRSVVTGVFLCSLRFPEYTVAEKIALWRGRGFSRSTGLFDTALHADLATAVPTLDVPVYFLSGAHDWTCNADLARAYLQALQAPVKGFYTFDASAHSPAFEEPERVNRVLQHDVLAGTTTLADRHQADDSARA